MPCTNTLGNFCVCPVLAPPCFCRIHVKCSVTKRILLRKSPGICSEAFVIFSSAAALLYRQLDARVCWFFRSGRTILATHPTRPLSVQGLPFSRTAFVCHISVSSLSFSLPASASSSNAGANAQRSGQSSIERRQSDTLFPCQLKSVQSVPS